MADDQVKKDAPEGDAKPRGRSDRGDKPAGKTGDAKAAAEKKPPPKPAGVITRSENIILESGGTTRSVVITARFTRGEQAMDGNGQLYRDETPLGAARALNPSGQIQGVLTGLPLSATIINVSANVVGTSVWVIQPIEIPAHPEPKKPDAELIGMVEFLDPEREATTGRNLITVLVYTPNGKAKKEVEVYLLDAKNAPDPPLPQDADDIVLTDDVGRAVLDITIPSGETSRDVLVMVPAKHGAVRRYQLRGPDVPKVKPLPLPMRRPGESFNDFARRCSDAGRGVSS
jgi:hypothetical protein